MRYVSVVLHGFLGVLVVGTMFRLAQYHLINAQNPHLQHVGRAMAVQY